MNAATILLSVDYGYCDVYCTVSLPGTDQTRVNHIAEQSAVERAKVLGALCNKAFAAR